MNVYPKTENISLSIVENTDETDAIIDAVVENNLHDTNLTKVKDVDGYTQPIIAADKNTELVLINFEDDTFRPVIKINEKYLNIIKKWYDTCNQLIDIEDTNIIIPKEINIDDISMILFKNMNYKHKDTFINEYVPKMLNYIVLKNK